MSKVYDFEYAKNNIEKHGYILVSEKGDYKDGSSNLVFKDSEGYFYKKTSNNFNKTIRNGRPPKFHSMNYYCVYNFSLWLSKNNRNWEIISPDYIKDFDGRRLRFYCNDCNNIFEMDIDAITYMRCGCPYCNRRRVSDINSLASSFLDLSKYFDYEKNYPNTMENISVGSSKKVWWKCCVCGNNWLESPGKMTRDKKLKECPFCFGKTPSDRNRLSILHPEIMEEWDFDKNKDIVLSSITYGSDKKVWWKCKICGYSYCAKICDRVNKKHGCASCSGKIITDRNRLSYLFPEISGEWDFEKNSKTPSDFSFGSHEEIWWICPICGHNYQCRISNRVHHRGCPSCNLSGKAQEIYKFLKNNNFDFDVNYWFKDLRSDLNRVLLYDFAIFDGEKVVFLIEYDDLHHTKYIPLWHKNEEYFNSRKEMDIRKNNYAENNEIPLLRIDYKNKNIVETLILFLKKKSLLVNS
jgi:hypothetical protein